MVEVSTRKEFANALKAKEKDIHVKNRVLFASIWAANDIKNLKKPKIDCFRSPFAVGCAVVSTSVVLTITICISIITIIAILNNYKCKITFNTDGEITVEYIPS